jgi:hypothetical protein
MDAEQNPHYTPQGPDDNESIIEATQPAAAQHRHTLPADAMIILPVRRTSAPPRLMPISSPA